MAREGKTEPGSAGLFCDASIRFRLRDGLTSRTGTGDGDEDSQIPRVWKQFLVRNLGVLLTCRVVAANDACHLGNFNFPDVIRGTSKARIQVANIAASLSTNTRQWGAVWRLCYRWRCKMNGMDDGEDENNFSEDEFAGLDDQDLLDLEQDALRFTQQAQPVQNNNYTRNAASDRGAWNGQVPSQPRTTAHNPYQNAPRHGQFEDSHDGTIYNDDGDVATPVEEKEAYIAPQRTPSETTQREQWRQQRYSRSVQQLVHNTPVRYVQQQSYQNSPQPEPEAMGYKDRSYTVGADNSMLLEDPEPVQQLQVSAHEEGLRARLDELVRERDELTKELALTKSTVVSQKGEISIIRANQARDSKTFDRQLTAMKKSLQDEAAENKRRIELIKAESDKIASDNKFLKQDLAEEARRSKTFHRTLQERPVNTSTGRAAEPNTTPKKAHIHSLRDGFDDDEIMAISPIKSGSARKSKGGTPTCAKRKRKAVDASPLPALALRQSGTDTAVEDKPVQPPKPEKALTIIKKDKTAERNLKFMQRILNHRSPGAIDRILETCMQYAFPAEPSKTFTSLILAATARLPPLDKRFRAELLAIFVDLWAKSLKQMYYKPIPSLMEVVCFIISLESSVVDEGTIKMLLPVLQNCGKINAEPRFNYSPVRQRAAELKQTPQSELKQECDSTRCLEILYDLASRCHTNDRLIELFWRSMDTDLVLMMLNSSQPIADMTLMLNLLSTSILHTTFGNICSTPDEQSKMETYIIRRVCYLLWETPRVDLGLPTPSKSQICNLRLEVMNLLDALVFTSIPHPHTLPTGHGATLLASHTDALARLVRSIYDEVDMLYLHRLAHPLHARLVNRGVNLLYHILQLQPSINLPAKLSAVNGGVHKYRVVLTRLAFSEGWYLDAGVSDECVGMARDMLEESVTPEEAEGLLEAFPEFARRVEGRVSQVQHDMEIGIGEEEDERPEMIDVEE